MRIVISGSAGSGKSTVAKALAKEFGYKHYSMGDFMRDIAAEKGLSLLELSRIAEAGRTIDGILDSKQKSLNKKDNFVIDSRLGAFFIEDSVKIFLDANLKTRAKRIMKRTESSNRLKETIRSMKKREESEKKRYREYYGIDCYDKTKFDKVIDTTDSDVEKVVEQIVNFIKKKG